MIDSQFSLERFCQDPYPIYRELRERNRPAWIESDPDLRTDGTWLFAKYQEVKRLFQLSDSVSKNLISVRAPESRSVFDFNILNQDGEAHRASLRRVSQFFALKSVECMTQDIREATSRCIDRLQLRDSFDLVEDFSEKIPVQVILKLLGLPDEDARQIRTWSLAVSPAFDSLQSNDTNLGKRKLSVFKDFNFYIRSHIRRPEALPENSLLKHLCANCGGVSEDEIAGTTMFLLFAGHETTISLISSSLLLLLRHPDQWRAIRQNIELIPATVEESLRFESPAQRSTFRVATEPLQLGGITVEPGQQVTALIGAANRDPAVFSNADTFDIGRKPNPHFSFGNGLHNCLGKHLARTEARIALEEISRRLPDLRLLDHQPSWRRNSFFRGLEALPAASGKVK